MSDRPTLRKTIHRSLIVTVLVTTAALVAVGAGLAFVGRPGRHVADFNRLATLGGNLYAESWADAAARRKLTESMARDLEVRVEVRDMSGSLLEQAGPDTCRGGTREMAVAREGQKLGTVRICAADGRRPLLRLIVSLGLIVGVLWLMATVIAARLGRPLAELTDAASRFGRGERDARAEEEQHSEELEVLAKTFNQMADRIQQQLDDQKRLLAETSHELRTPLGHARVLLELLRDSGADEDRVRELENEVAAMDDLVEQLLAKSRVDFELTRLVPLDPVELAIAAMERIGVDPTRLSADEALPEVAGDAALLSSALANLIRNAETHGEGLTALDVKHSNGAVEFAVRDAGAGFDAEHAFEAFVQGDESRGLGLGLALVDRIAQAHSGTVSAETSEAGSVVRLRIPAVEQS